ncbi:hypothetical protein DENSPDRAFT_842758 [Dentipellis sp. KUC8613]|nr:hypothetical protein DENSPDRAFT_842758 [Dentipellis sp. KUC8613]
MLAPRPPRPRRRTRSHSPTRTQSRTPPALPPFLPSSDPPFVSLRHARPWVAVPADPSPPPALELVSRRDPASDPAILSSLGHTVPTTPSLALSPRVQ